MKMKYLLTATIFCLFLTNLLNAQEKQAAPKRIQIPFVHFDGGISLMGGDMAGISNYNLVVGGGFGLKSKKNFLYDIDFSYSFSDEVKEPWKLIPNIVTKNGLILDNGGTNAAISYSLRSYSFMAKFGKILLPTKRNKDAGFFGMLGVGYLGSFYRIKEQKNAVPQIYKDYGKLYDKHRGGIALSQSIGFIHFGEQNLSNFIIQFEVKENFSKSLRDFDMILNEKDTKSYMDIYCGLKVSWMFPFKKKVKEYYYN